MKFLLALLVIILTVINTSSFAKYCWKSKNKSAAVGAAVILIISVIFPIVIFMYRR